MLTVDDLKKELGISGTFQPRHVQAIRSHPTIKTALEFGDLPRLRKQLGIPENGHGVRFLMKLSDLIKAQNRFEADANKYSDAVLKSDAKGYAWGNWQYGEGKADVDFFYGVRGEADALFWDEFQAADHNQQNFRAHLQYSSQDGHLSADQIAQRSRGPIANKDIYMCGPISMVEGFSKSFKAMGVPVNQIHYEEFNFR